LYTELAEQITRAFYVVYNNLGSGFQDTVYANALAVALQKTGHKVEQKRPIQIYYDGQVVGEYRPDLIVNDVVLVEVKAVPKLLKEYETELSNCLRAIPYEVALLVNFGPEPEIKRKSCANKHKPNLPKSAE
jgi:GxxExxY protein